jgi:hypothetical protein
LMPWLWRHFRGRSSGDGRDPRRGALAGVEGLADLLDPICWSEAE